MKLETTSPTLLPRAGFVYARANGGHLWHLVPIKGDTSVCGHTPRDTKGMARAGWMQIEGGRCPANGRTCRKCLSK